MNQIILKETTLQSSHHSRKFLMDTRWKKGLSAHKPLVLFVHGFKGFKDWGPFNAIADIFAENGFVFAKLNLSHNGTTPEKPLDFADLEAFGHNNFSIELSDITETLDYLIKNANDLGNFNPNSIYLIGHSRGGGLVILQGKEDERVQKVATWAAVSDFFRLLNPEDVEKWKTEGVRYIWNGRTKQQMPQYFQIYEDLMCQKERFNIPEAAKKMDKPLLLIHGSADETVPHSAMKDIATNLNYAETYLIEGAGHTFSGKHPFDGEALPNHLKDAVEKTLGFFKAS